jgi:hypothetical protein
MNKTQTPSQNSTVDKSALEKFKLFFEHTDDSRVVVNAQSKPVKPPTRNAVTKR